MTEIRTLTIKYLERDAEQLPGEELSMEMIRDVRRQIVYQGARIDILIETLKRDKTPVASPPPVLPADGQT